MKRTLRSRSVVVAALLVGGIGCGSANPSTDPAETGAAGVTTREPSPPVVLTARGLPAVTSFDFTDQVLLAGDPVVVEFGAVWCQHCRALGDLLGGVARRGTTRVFTVDVDDEPDLAERYAIDSLPTLVVFLAGEPLGQVRGVRDRAALEPLFSALALRQSERVRAALATLGEAADGDGCAPRSGAGTQSAVCTLPAPCENC